MQEPLTPSQLTQVRLRLSTMAIGYNVSMSPERLDWYIATIGKCARLTTYDRIIRAIDMAETQLHTFPMPSNLNTMFSS